MENLILFCGNNAQGDERIMNILEIVVLILREQVFKKKKDNLLYLDNSSSYSQQKNWLIQVNNNQKINEKKIMSKLSLLSFD